MIIIKEFVNIKGIILQMNVSTYPKEFCCIVCILFPFFLYSQGEFNNWYFGDHAGITFNYGDPPVALTDCSTAFWCNAATITESDSLGHLLFYSDGIKVYNRNHFVMPNGHGVNPNNASGNQMVFYVPYLHDTNFFLSVYCGESMGHSTSKS